MIRAHIHWRFSALYFCSCFCRDSSLLLCIFCKNSNITMCHNHKVKRTHAALTSISDKIISHTHTALAHKRVTANQWKLVLVTITCWRSDAVLLSNASFILCCCRLTSSFLCSAWSKPCCHSRFLTSCSLSASSFWIWSCFCSYSAQTWCYNFSSWTIMNETNTSKYICIDAVYIEMVLKFF